MSVYGVLEIILLLVILLAITKPLGLYLTWVLDGHRTLDMPVIGGFEKAIYRVIGVKPLEEQGWKAYAAGVLLFSAASFGLLYLILRTQNWLPLNPEGFGALSPDLAFNTAVSFITNTNWQSYSGESTMSYFSQMAGLAVQNFVSAAVGLAVAVAVVRGLARRSASTIGNFWVDIVRSVIYVLLPIAIVLALVFVSQGTPQNFNSYVSAHTVQGAMQSIAQGPVASQEVIKQLGTNGGGFMNANSAHPYENPNGLTNFLAILAEFAIPAGLVYMFGRMMKDTRQGWVLWAAMAILFIGGISLAYPAEQAGNPLFSQVGVDQRYSDMQAGGNFEGKETRFGIASSTLFTVVTTDTSCGAVNNMHDSLLPLAGLVPIFNMQLGEVVFGGVGSGLYGMLIFAILTVFLAGLMVGRTPEYLGKKIEPFEMKMATLFVLISGADILIFTAIGSIAPPGLAGIANAGPHGFSEILYAFSSGTANNGSAFAGLSANTPFYNTTLGLAMLIGRFLMMLPPLAIAGSMVKKQTIPPSLGTFPTRGVLFVVLLVAVLIIVVALTYFPALALGPIVEQLLLAAGKIF
jgi:potassium-transporting ATPase potassium-binding subunit